MSLLTVNNLSSGYGKKQILEDISFSLEAGTLCGIIGANGSGKTTLIKAIGGILPRNGECLIEDKNLSLLSKRDLAKLISMVPQKSGISIDMSVLDVVLMGFNPYLGLLQQPTSDMKVKAARILECLGLTDRIEDNYLHLSEGQKQLCIIARSMITDSKLVIMDEPESALDYSIRYNVMDTIKSTIKDSNRCLLASLHDVNLALNYCDKLLLIKDKCILDIVDLHADSLDVIESKLRKIYGAISVHKIATKSNTEQLIMLKDMEA
ncbi:MAG: ABC transporter ATP-binding protein [Saccharofermentans sp.]|nr:ABC transporter ATP-binding protein [Saccharofermentans sp.]